MLTKQHGVMTIKRTITAIILTIACISCICMHGATVHTVRSVGGDSRHQTLRDQEMPKCIACMSDLTCRCMYHTRAVQESGPQYELF